MPFHVCIEKYDRISKIVVVGSDDTKHVSLFAAHSEVRTGVGVGRINTFVGCGLVAVCGAVGTETRARARNRPRPDTQPYRFSQIRQILECIMDSLGLARSLLTFCRHQLDSKPSESHVDSFIEMDFSVHLTYGRCNLSHFCLLQNAICV